jgi:hypothetical protein
MKSILSLLFLVLPIVGFGQSKDFAFGATLRELGMNDFPGDTSAVAVVLNEFGNCFFDETSGNIHFEYHTKIKILKQEGAGKANIEISTYRNGTLAENKEYVKGIKASSFNLENGSLKETKLDHKNVFSQDINEHWAVQKFAIPNVRAGSVIDYTYTIETPFKFNFRNWEFQSDIPKLKSTYSTSIPGNYQYNITLKGFLKLSGHEQKIKRDCYRYGSASADCAEAKFEMVNIPAFRVEDYMSAKANYLSALNFELSEIKTFDGRVIKYTKEWKDTDHEMKTDEKFGLQLKRGSNALEDEVEKAILGETDPLAKARKIYDMVKYHYLWNDITSKYSESIKKAFEAKTGTSGDINLSLIAALRKAKLQVDPVILSTRANGLPIEIHPVLSDFNYVIARLTIGAEVYLLDATEDLLPFGTLPIRCLNGKGRVMAEGESYWLPMTAKDKDRRVSMVTLALGKDGKMKGKVSNLYSGYAAIRKRSEILSANGDDYVNRLRSSLSAEISQHSLKNLDTLEKPLTETFDLEIDAFNGGLQDNLLLNPFIMWKTRENPFKSADRLYPVDFGVPVEENIIVTLELPEDYELTDLPAKIALTLPGNGGKYMYGASATGNKVTINNLLTIARTVYTSQEYHYLKELYSRLIQVQSIDLVFRKKG